MFIDEWDSFFQQARELFIAEPTRTRFCMRYRHVDGRFYLRVTDDRTCLQFKSDQAVDLKRLEALNGLAFAACAKGPEAAEEEQEEQQQPAASAQPQQRQGGNRKSSRRRG